MILDIAKLGEDVLRQKAEPVKEVNDEIRKLAQDMFETMIESEGVGLAAPQVRKSLRMFVLIADDDIRRVFINPQIIKTSEEVSDYDEGCLSIPQVYETITRPVKVTVQALNEKGKPFTLDADGLLARIIQHEYDHLEGHVHVDHLAPLRKMLLQSKLRDISEGKCDVDYRMIFPKKQKNRR
jgi:peptide deformylase